LLGSHQLRGRLSPWGAHVCEASLQGDTFFGCGHKGEGGRLNGGRNTSGL
jgi:hypothetical protein